MTYPTPSVPSGNHVPAVRTLSEKKLGILHYASPMDFGWRGDIRKRYTDFLVNEVRKDGTVLHLSGFKVTEDPTANENTGPPKHYANNGPELATKPAIKPSSPIKAEIPQEDVEALERLVGSNAAKEMLQLYAAILNKTAPRNASVNLAIHHDRNERAHIHHEIRRIFSNRFETQADPKTGMITAKPGSVAPQRRDQSRNFGGNGNWRDNRDNNRFNRNRNGGMDYLHFTMYKENKDTMDAINHIARMLKIKSSNFGFAGTKDRRAATTQRVSVWRQNADNLNWLNGRNSNIKVGDFSFHKAPIQLGQHGGNEFVIVVKNVELVRGKAYSLQHRLVAVERCVQTALDKVLENGFINYFGLQRFGTHTIGTQEIGMKILSGDFEGAINCILHVDPHLVSSTVTDKDLETIYHRDEIYRARAIAVWRTTGNLEEALKILPKRFNAEGAILRHLGRVPETRRDYCGALLQITRGLRNLYIHAYQSYVWNWVASARWAKYGNKVIKGDLILVEAESNPARFRDAKDMSEDINQEEEEFYQQARMLTAEEAASGEFSIFDIVLPVPGFDCLYPDNEVGEFYVDFMGRQENGGLNPYNMRRRQREFSLSGHYRKIVARFTDVPKFVVRPYLDDSEQMHPTELDEIKNRKQEENIKREEIRAASSSWRHFAQNADEFDSAEAELRRRRRAAERSSEPPETRINEKWIETALDGSSKRMKVDQHRQVHLKTNENQLPPIDGSIALTSGSLAMEDAFGQVGTAVAAAAPVDGDATDATDAISHRQSPFPTKEGQAKSAFSELYRPDAEELHIEGFSPKPEHPSIIPPNEVVAAGGDLPKLGDFDPNNPTSRPTTASSETTKPSASSANSAPFPPRDLAEIRAEALLPVTTNVFKDVKSDAADGKAINLTGDWTRNIPGETMKIAVLLNFRLSASNYATICLRELMSSHVPEMPTYEGA